MAMTSTPTLPRPSFIERLIVNAHDVRMRLQWRPRPIRLPIGLNTPLAKLLGLCMGIGAGVAGLLWVPWLTVLNGPFALTLHHPRLFYSLAIFVSLSAVIAACNADEKLPSGLDDKVKGWSVGVAIFTGLLTCLCSVGLMIGTTEDHVASTLHMMTAAKTAVASARAVNKGTDFPKIITLANAFLAAGETGLQSLSAYGAPTLGEVAFAVDDLNQHECEMIVNHMDPDFMVTWVNNVQQKSEVPGTPVVCPNLWENTLQFSNRPHTL
jgi:hypothetical protein